MCSPFVLTQVARRLEKTPLEKFSSLTRLRNFALLPYHLGRISTYAFIGFCCSFLSQNLREISDFKTVSVLFLLVASLCFFGIFFERKVFDFLRNLKLPFKSSNLEAARLYIRDFFSKKISFFFQNPQGIRGYFLGVILGFIPCGLLYGAFAISAAILNPFFAALGMIFFGIGTFPALFLAGSGAAIFFKNSNFKIFVKAVILLNAITLLLMAISKLI